VPTEPDDELVALVDADGTPVGSAPRSLVRRDNLLHSATAVLVRDGSGQIYLHRRSPAKDWAPGFHDCAAGGVLRHGEVPAESAARELAEELGIEGALLRPLGTSLYEDDALRCLEHCYETAWDGPVRHVDDEVAWGTWTTLEDLDRRLREPSWPFVPDTRQLLAGLAVDRVGDYAALTSLTQAPPAADPADRSGRALVAADLLGLHYEVTRHGPVTSLEEAARARGLPPDAVVKTIVVRVRAGDYRFVLVPGLREIAWQRLRTVLGVNRLSLPDAETAREATGYVRGTITPLGSTHPWPVVADQSLDGRVSIGGGAHGFALTVDAGELVEALGATVADVTNPRE
jgi:Cys-tRNA(Pro) deacylase